MTITVAAVDDHGATLVGISHALRGRDDIEYLGGFTSPHEIEAVGVPDVVLLDLRLHDSSDPFINATTLTELGCRVLVYSSLESPYLIRRALLAGVHGVLDKSADVQELAEAIRTIATEGTYASANWASVIDSDGRFAEDSLSPRQREVLELYASGESARRVASLLGISQETVNDYLDRIRLKYSVTGRNAVTKIDMLLRAQEDGYLPGPTDPRPIDT
ncbi:response regulator transcription factor [Corynebacterium guangdongense]|uniref:DNA-binding NarL/FixJ family response regulator n=1 Tax=Corynebacterium guangdongense TaxID=1783348 RepID=A0ABU1ZZ94_9CORY|nr:response regulator transcription factor [Corynebacterium guangdongense]MDR7329208.1 DNA-binding NarL/FixJ family response regulator [Corynebacterium guangdongense]WJZ17774.1 Transcriptional regulatory protein UhpA [Corynebacterium guangdongense]